MNIIFYGAHYWDAGAWFRKQQFAYRLSKRGHRVFYIEESKSIIHWQKGDRNSLFKTNIIKKNDNLYIITPSCYFPFPNNFMFRKIYNLKLLFEIKKILKNLGINEYIFWFNKIEISSVIEYIPQKKIFDLCDDIPYYSKLIGDEKAYNIKMKYIKLAFSNSDISVVSAVRLKEKYKKFTKTDIIVIPNGHNIDLKQIKLGTIPDDIRKIRRPIIGFLGTLFEFIDGDLLEYIISKKPEYNFVFVGGIESNFPIDKLVKYQNFVHLGKKPKETIPNYINSFDICINPFKVHEVNDSVSPVKVFEYLVLNKYVVSSFMYSLQKEDISSYINFAKNKVEFLSLLDNTLGMKSYVNNIPPNKIASYHWDNLFDRLIKNINAKGVVNL